MKTTREQRTKFRYNILPDLQKAIWSLYGCFMLGAAISFAVANPSCEVSTEAPLVEKVEKLQFRFIGRVYLPEYKDKVTTFCWRGLVFMRTDKGLVQVSTTQRVPMGCSLEGSTP
jgi:hypothetical protein